MSTMCGSASDNLNGPSARRSMLIAGSCMKSTEKHDAAGSVDTVMAAAPVDRPVAGGLAVDVRSRCSVNI